MSNVNLEGLSIEQLNALTKQANAEIEKQKRAKVGEAYQQIVEVAKSVGMSLEELVDYGRKGKKKTTSEKAPVEPKYRNPANASETWTGRGKKPRWLQAAVDAGKKLEDFLIK